jgi:hypothetical protein
MALASKCRISRHLRICRPRHSTCAYRERMKEANKMRKTKNYLIGAAFLFTVFGVRNAIAADIRDVPVNPPATVMEKVTPAEARAGEVVTVEGESLDAAHLKTVFLTDRKDQVEVEIVVQTAKYLRFKVPAVAPGKWRIAIELVRDNLLLEEPVFLLVLPDKG